MLLLWLNISVQYIYTNYKMPLAITSATGKLGGGVLNAILENKLIDPKDLVICVSPTCCISSFQSAHTAARHLQTPKASVSMLSAPWA